MSKTPAKELHSLLRTNFSPTVPNHGGKRMTLNSVYSLTFAINTRGGTENMRTVLPSDIYSAFIRNSKNISFISSNTRKHDQQNTSAKWEVWTLLSSPKFAKKYKAPQENIPQETVEEVTNILLESLEECLNLPANSLREGAVLETKLQLWGAAVPVNNWRPKKDEGNRSVGGFLYDNKYGVGACGDWLLDSSIQGAWESGRRLAEHMIETQKTRPTDSHTSSIGLPPDGGVFVASSKALKDGIASLKN